MTETVNTLDEFLLGLSEDSDWRCVRREELYGAFAVTRESLLALEALMLRVATPSGTRTTPTEKVVVVFSGKPSEQYASIREVLELRNPRVGRITGISMQVKGSEGLISIWLDDVGVYSFHSIVFLIAGDSEGRFEEIAASITAECENMRCWYSPVRRWVDLSGSVIRRIPALVVYGLILVSPALILLGALWDQRQYEAWRTTAQSAINVYNTVVANGDHADANMVAGVSKLNDMLKHPRYPVVGGVIRIVVSLLLGYLVVMISTRMSPLFPRVMFEIGDGLKRSEQITRLRQFVIGSVAICGIILPLVRHALLS